MKVVSTEALTKLIQLVKSAFIKVDDVVEVTEIDTETPSEITLATVATSGDYDDLINKPTIPTVNNATLTIQKNGSNVATFTANASSNVTANISVPTKVSDLTNDSGFITGITSSDVTTALGYTPYNSTNPSGYQANVIETVKVNGTALTPSSKAVDVTVPTTTSSVTSGSTAALTSGGAYTNLVRRLSTSAATGSASQGVYVDANGQVQTCTAVTSTYAATGTAPVNGTAVSNAIAVKQDTLVSGTNIKTINGNSLLGSGNITIETSSTPNVDGTTISYNANDALQTIAVKNVRDGSALPIWHGTEYQWNHGDPTTWYYWQTSVQALWTSGGSLPSSKKWRAVTYGDSKFVAVNDSYSDEAAYSTDGVTWTASTMPSYTYQCSVTYGDGKFVAVARYSDEAAYSTDGVTWTASTMPSSASWSSVAYGDGKFVAIARSSDEAAYSTDGVTWTASTLPSSASWSSVAYGDGKFVAIAESSTVSAYSTDGGVTWQSGGNMPSSDHWISVAYGDGKFVAIAGGEYSSNKSTYSTDGGVTWQSSILPRSGYWTSMCYGNGMFVIISQYSSKNSLYSTDGINWMSSFLPSNLIWYSVTYGDGKFVAVAQNSDETAIFSVSYDKCYTDTANPTTSSVVYSAPETASSYTISSVTSGAITLSNNNTYYYNQSGNTSTYDTVGNSHPEYLCFIDGVGVKIGNTTIATNNSNS